MFIILMLLTGCVINVVLIFRQFTSLVLMNVSCIMYNVHYVVCVCVCVCVCVRVCAHLHMCVCVCTCC